MHATKTTHAHYYWWIKYWQFLLQIANHQSLLLANISSYAVSTIPIPSIVCQECYMYISSGEFLNNIGEEIPIVEEFQ